MAIILEYKKEGYGYKNYNYNRHVYTLAGLLFALYPERKRSDGRLELSKNEISEKELTEIVANAFFVFDCEDF